MMMKKIPQLFLFVLILTAIFAPYFLPDPYTQEVSTALQNPNFAHPMGKDSLGRDLFSRLIYGARISILVGLGSALIALVLGAVVGACSAYAGGKTDQWLMRLVDLGYSFPSLLVIVLVKEVVEQGDPRRGLWAIVFALSLYSWMQIARVVRGEILHLRELPFIEAARATGVSGLRIVFKHLLPNTWGPLLVTLTLRIPLNILAESMLGFVGLGVKSPMASWGTMAAEGWTAMRFHPHLILFPSLMLFLTIFSLNLVGEDLRDFLDPRNHGNLPKS